MGRNESETQSEALLEMTLVSPAWRAAAVRRARARLAAPNWCKAEEVAAALVDSWVKGEAP